MALAVGVEEGAVTPFRFGTYGHHLMHIHGFTIAACGPKGVVLAAPSGKVPNFVVVGCKGGRLRKPFHSAIALDAYLRVGLKGAC